MSERLDINSENWRPIVVACAEISARDYRRPPAGTDEAILRGVAEVAAELGRVAEACRERAEGDLVYVSELEQRIANLAITVELLAMQFEFDLPAAILDLIGRRLADDPLLIDQIRGRLEGGR